MIPTWIVPAAEGLAAFSPAAGVASYATFAPRSGVWIKSLSRGRTDLPRISLTFDDGPTPPYTDRILDILAESKTRAAFFVIGSSAAQHPDLLRRMDSEGHIIANHSFHHRHGGILRGRQYWESEIRRTDDLIEQTIGRRPLLFRPPLGYKSPFMAGVLRRHGHHLIAWQHRAMDGIATTPRRILDRLLPSVEAGDILLMHDGIEPYHLRDAMVSVNVLRPLIEGIRAKGLGIVGVDELLGVGAYA